MLGTDDILMADPVTLADFTDMRRDIRYRYTSDTSGDGGVDTVRDTDGNGDV